MRYILCRHPQIQKFKISCQQFMSNPPVSQQTNRPPPTPFKESVWVLPQTKMHWPVELSSTGITRRDRNYRINSEGRDYYVLEYIIAGKGHLFIDNHHYRPAAGDVYLLPPHLPHTYYSTASDPWEKIWFNVSGDLIDSLVECFGLTGVIYQQRTGLENLFRRGMDVVRCFDQNSYSSLAAIITHILAELRQQRGTMNLNLSPEAVQMKKYLDTHWRGKFNQEALCELTGKSVAQTLRIFKREYGITPGAYRQKRRYSMALSYLENTRSSVRDIAMTLGFANEFHFSQWFKKQNSLSPEFYRKKFFGQ